MTRMHSIWWVSQPDERVLSADSPTWCSGRKARVTGDGPPRHAGRPVRGHPREVVKRLLVVCALLAAGPAFAQMPPGMGANMPDARQMSGTPLPTGEVPAGTVIVRVVRGSMANPLAGETVELIAGPAGTRIAKTNELGRAEFPGLAVGSRVRAVATVSGERLESQEFELPAAGGIRVALVALDPEMEKRADEDRRMAQMPPQPGMVVLGEQSRFVIEMGDEGLHVFNIMGVMNTARTPVETEPLVFELPRNAERASMLEGSSPQGQLRDGRVTVIGPFAPGTTLVQFAYGLPLKSANLTVEQKLPAALSALTVMTQRVGDLHITSPQFANHRDMATGGETYILGQGPALRAGDTIVLNLTGLPHAPAWPTHLAVAVAAVILLVGAWGSMQVGRSGATAFAARRKKLEGRRDRLFAELTALETGYRERTIPSDVYTPRRRELVAALERVYAELDEEAAA